MHVRLSVCVSACAPECVRGCMCARVAHAYTGMQVLQRPEEGIISPGAGLTDSYELVPTYVCWKLNSDWDRSKPSFLLSHLSHPTPIVKISFCDRIFQDDPFLLYKV